MKVIGDLWVCSDCLIFIANGDLTGLDNDPESADARQKAILAGCEREAPMQWVAGLHECGEHGPDEREACIDAGCETHELSRTSCDCCGESLAGSRHAATLIGPD